MQRVRLRKFVLVAVGERSLFRVARTLAALSHRRSDEGSKSRGGGCTRDARRSVPELQGEATREREAGRGARVDLERLRVERRAGEARIVRDAAGELLYGLFRAGVQKL